MLGPLEVWHEAAPVTLSGAKPRELLALLAVRPNQPVSPAALIDQLWDGAAPATAASALRVHVGRVRQALEPQKPDGRSERLTLDAAGYVLHVSTDELDSLRFEHLLDRGRDANRGGDVPAAERHLCAALACWRGPALLDVRDLAAAQGEIARLEQLRVSAVGEFADAKLALGHHREIVDLLFAEVRRTPLDEGLTARFMLALYRSGRQAEALRAFSTLQRQLDDELGAEPSAELRQLETDMLLHEEHLDFVDRPAAHPMHTERSARTTRLIGRRPELEQLLALHTGAEPGTRFALISGVAGVGKTALANEYCRRAQPGGAVVLTGHCGTDSDEYQPIVEILTALEPTLDEPARAGAVQLIEFLRTGSVASAKDVPDPAAEQLRLVQDFASVLRTVPARPLVLLIEDLHWADHATFRVLGHLLRHAGIDGLVIVGTHRSDELGAHQQQLIDRLAPPSRTQHHRLEGFDDHEVRAFLRTIADPRVAENLVAVSTTFRDVSDGNPFHIAALARDLEERELLSSDREQLDASVRNLTPVDVGDLIRRRVSRLSEPARHVVDVAAVIGHDISLGDLATVCGVEADTVMESIYELLDHDLLAEAIDRVGMFDFPHDLARNAIYGSIPAELRIRLHARVGELLEAQRDAGAAATAADLARHLLAAIPLADEEKAAHYAEAAGREAADRLALDEAATWYERALEVRATPADARGRIHLALARAYATEKRYDEARDACFRGAAYARETDDPALLADLALAATGSWANGFESGGEAQALLEEALTMVGDADPQRRLRLLARLATLLHYSNAQREAGLVQEAHVIAERLADDNARAEALLARHLWLTHAPSARRERLAMAQHAMELLEAGGTNPVRLRVGRELLTDLLENGEISGFDVEVARYERLAAETLSPRDLYWSAALRATQATLRGDLVAGEQLARGAALRGDELQQRAAGTEFLQRFVIRFQQARLSEVVTAVRAAPDPSSVYRAGGTLAALACAETGRIEDALRLAHWSMGTPGDEMSRDSFWLGAHACLAGVAAAACDPALARRLNELLAPCTDHIVVYGAGAAVLGSAHQWLGVLAVVVGDIDPAIEHLIEAERVAERLGLPYWRAQAQIDLAATLDARGRGDGARVRRLTNEAVAIAEKNGFGRILARAADVIG